MLQINLSEQQPWLSSAELCASSDIDFDVLYELVEYNIASPIEGDVIEHWRFSIESAVTVKKATRIKRDLALDWGGIALILELLEERDALQQTVHELQQQLSRFK